MKSSLRIPALLLILVAFPEMCEGGNPWKYGGSSRTRVEHWDWFDPGSPATGRENSYTYGANLLKLQATKVTTSTDYAFELAVPWLIGLPDDAIAPGALGQLGLGGTYRAANGGQEVGLNVRQAAVTFKSFEDRHLKLKLGRFEFIEGQEALTGDPTLDFLKKERIAHRLIGNFGFTHVQRSFDGIMLTHDKDENYMVANVLRPTAGVFDLDANEGLDDVTVGYLAWTRKGSAERADVRLFSVLYDDSRTVLKTDNRPVAVRTADPEAVSVQSFGAHLVDKVGEMDVLAWGTVQTGEWGRLDHEGWAYAAEIGWQPDDVTARPWLRAGVNASSGDRDPTDGKHETFFQVLPTPRIYARFPFFNMMNVRDLFVQLILRPTERLTARLDFHELDLEESADLWYLGGGAFQESTFGFVGRPSGGFNELASLMEISLDYKLSDTTGLTLYSARANGGSVVRSLYPGDAASLTYLELNHRF